MFRKPVFMALGLSAGLLSGSLSAGMLDLTRTAALPSISTLKVVDRGVTLKEERKWVALDESQEPGTEATIQLDRKASDAQRTVFNLSIPGFWMVSKLGGDGREYQQILIPGLGSQDQVGLPDLPRYRFQLALPFNKGEVRMSGKVREMRRFQDVLVWPQPVPELDGDDESGTPEKFVIDREVYAGKTP